MDKLLHRQSHVPDILDTITKLSSNEVPTPPEIANAIINSFPDQLWKDPELKILDPFCKSGVFLREIAKRLFEGLKDQFPDENKRREHIFQNMLYGVAITRMSSLMSRRSVYYTKDASSKYSVVKFDNSDGNIVYENIDHVFNERITACDICKAPEKWVTERKERPETLDLHAYQFIHDTKLFDGMRFDIVIGNPPYQIEDGGFGASATPIYQLFVEQAFKLKPRYVSMIIPSRWFAGGKNLDEFRDKMLQESKFKKLVDFPDASDIFPDIKLEGGVCYFLWDNQHDGPCEVVTMKSGAQESAFERYLGEFDVLVRFNSAVPIIRKVLKKTNNFADSIFESSKPFGMRTFFKEYSKTKKPGFLNLYLKGQQKYFVDPKYVTKNHELINKYKVLTSKGYGMGSYPSKVILSPFIAGKGTVCTETYQVAGTFDTKNEAENFKKFLETKFARFLIAMRKNTQDLTKDKMKFVPLLDMKKEWTNNALYKEYNITAAEQKFIDTIVSDLNKNE